MIAFDATRRAVYYPPDRRFRHFRKGFWFHEPVHENILPAPHWAVAIGLIDLTYSLVGFEQLAQWKLPPRNAG